MIVSNKTISLDESALGLSHHILEAGTTAATPAALWKVLQKKYPSIDDFLMSLDVLYVLGKIELTDGVITYVD